MVALDVTIMTCIPGFRSRISTGIPTKVTDIPWFMKFHAPLIKRQDNTLNYAITASFENPPKSLLL